MAGIGTSKEDKRRKRRSLPHEKKPQADRARAVAKIVKSRTKPGRTLTKQQKKDLTKRVKDEKGPQPWRTAKKDRENDLRDKRAKLRAKQRIKKVLPKKDTLRTRQRIK